MLLANAKPTRRDETASWPGKKPSYFFSASCNNPGLTALIRMPRGISIAAEITNASSAPSQAAALAPCRIGSRERMPLVSVNEPPSFTCGWPNKTRLTMPITLSFMPSRNCSGVIVSSGPKYECPAVHATASTLPILAYMTRTEAASIISTFTSPCLRPALIISWPARSPPIAACPTVPSAPTKRMRIIIYPRRALNL